MTTQQKFLLHMGIHPDIAGFDFLDAAITYWRGHKQPGKTPALSTEVYPAVADMFGANQRSAERAMRHAIESAYDQMGAGSLIYEVFPYSTLSKKGKLTVGQFISSVALFDDNEMEDLIRKVDG